MNPRNHQDSVKEHAYEATAPHFLFGLVVDKVSTSESHENQRERSADKSYRIGAHWEKALSSILPVCPMGREAYLLRRGGVLLALAAIATLIGAVLQGIGVPNSELASKTAVNADGRLLFQRVMYSYECVDDVLLEYVHLVKKKFQSHLVRIPCNTTGVHSSNICACVFHVRRYSPSECGLFLCFTKYHVAELNQSM